MPARTIHDTISDRTGHRLPIEKAKGSNESTYNYSNGVSLRVEKTGDGIPGRMKEIRTITKITTPRVTSSMQWTDDEQFDRIFRKGNQTHE